MGRAKDIILRPISSKNANRIISTLHYSGKVVNNSKLHLGVFIGDKCGGAMSFGPPLDKSKLLGLVRGTAWTQMMELNRMAFADWMPRNGESRSISVAMRILRKRYSFLKWIVSFADATQCGDGTIYRASGFILTGIKASKNLVGLPDGSVIHKMTLESGPTRPREELHGRSYFDVTGGRYDLAAYCRSVSGSILPGFQLRYVYFIDPSWRSRLTVPEIPFSRIDEIGARMYRGKRLASEA